MRTQEEIFDVWAPPDGVWSPWVKPVLFACMTSAEPLWPETSTTSTIANAGPELDVTFAPPPGETALVLDLPGADGVGAGIALATHGYRPVPLYNALPGPQLGVLAASATPGPTELVSVRPILNALHQAADRVANLSLAPEAPPAFLLDANRRGGQVMPLPGRFDNRSVSFVTDFPSANVLYARGIRRVILAQRAALQPQEDLAHTLRRWQEAGLLLASARLDQAGPLFPCDVPKPSLFRNAWQRVLAMTGFRRHILGGFGGFIPQASSS